MGRESCDSCDLSSRSTDRDSHANAQLWSTQIKQLASVIGLCRINILVFSSVDAGVGAATADVTLLDAVARNRSVLECDDGELRVGLYLLLKSWKAWQWWNKNMFDDVLLSTEIPIYIMESHLLLCISVHISMGVRTSVYRKMSTCPFLHACSLCVHPLPN